MQHSQQTPALKVVVFDGPVFHRFEIKCVDREDARQTLHYVLDEARRCGDRRLGWQIAQVIPSAAVEQNGMPTRTLVHLPGVIHLYGAREGRTECGESTYGSTVTMSREPVTCEACAALEPDVLRAIAS